MGEGGESSAKGSTKLEIEVMDTPERSRNNQIATSNSKFEDSPVFNFLNSLSPIKPVKSVHITQTINPLSFVSLPSIFTSPQVTSLKESRFLRRHQLSDPSKPEFSSDDRNTVDTNTVNMEIAMKLDEQKENLDPSASNCEVADEPSYDCLKIVHELAENVDYDSNSRNSSLGPSFVSALGSLTYRNEGSLDRVVGHIDQNKEATLCDWDCLISDASDLSVFESPNGTELHKKPVDPATSFYRSIKNAIHNVQSLGTTGSGKQYGDESERENMSTRPGEGTEMTENGVTHHTLAGSSILDTSQKMDYEHLSGLCRGMRRRCLFEMGRKHVGDSSASDSPMLLRSDENTSSTHQTVPEKTTNNPSRLLPGIGLHLNALATTPKDIKIVNHEASSSRRLLIGPSSSSNSCPANPSQELLSNTLADYSLDRETNTMRNGVLPIEDPSLMANEEINTSSPKKRKRRLEQGGEAEACKRCNCKKSKCLKL